MEQVLKDHWHPGVIVCFSNCGQGSAHTGYTHSALGWGAQSSFSPHFATTESPKGWPFTILFSACAHCFFCLWYLSKGVIYTQASLVPGLEDVLISHSPFLFSRDTIFSNLLIFLDKGRQGPEK